MSHQKTDWIKWGAIFTLAACLLGCVAWIGRVTDIARSPERMDKIDIHLSATDDRVTNLEQFRATNTITVVYMLQDLEKKIDSLHRDVTN